MGLTARLVAAALAVGAVLIAANVAFFLAERHAAYRDDLVDLTEEVALQLVRDYESYLSGIIAAANAYATANSAYRDAVLAFDGGYDARVAIYGALVNLQSGYSAIQNSYLMLPGELITFRSFTGEFAEPGRFPEYELATQMVPGVTMEIIHDRTISRGGSSIAVSTLLIRPFRSLGRPDAVIIVDIGIEAINRHLRDRVTLFDHFSVEQGEPGRSTPTSANSNSPTAVATSASFDRAFYVTLEDAGAVSRRRGTAFVLGSVVTACVLFAVVALLLVRRLTPIERELTKLADRPADLSSLADAVRDLARDNEQLRVRYDRVLPHYRRRVMNHLLLGLLTEGTTLDERLSFTGTHLPEPPYVAICVLFADAERSDRETASIILLIASAIELEVGTEAADLLCAVDALRHGTVVPHDAVARIPAALDRLPDAVRGRIFVGVGNPVMQPGDLARSYDSARRALTFRRLLGGSIFSADDIDRRFQDQQGYPFDLERSLLLAVQRRDLESAESRLAEMLSALGGCADPMRGLEYLRLQLLHVMEGRLSGQGASPAVLDGLVDEFPLEEANTPDAVSALFRDLLHRAVGGERATDDRDDQVAEFLRYIEEHHADHNLQLLSLEEAFGLSRYYIGRRINEVTGQHFSEHLNRARVEHGARLLEERPPIPIKRIAALVGYSYDYYFARQFKAAYGIAPSEYRDRA